jgi:PTH1 family peptidyl-tRNA hydrolase
MTYTIVGLGNPEPEYKGTRHNVGRFILQALAKKFDFTDWKEDQKIKALVAKGSIAGKNVTLILPNNFMNNSGGSVSPLISEKKDLAKLLIVYDDIDIPVGRMKLSFNRSSGGHNGLESIIKKVRSQEFARVRIGICPTTPTGKLKKPTGEKPVIDFLMKEFREAEVTELKKIAKRVGEAVEIWINEGLPKAMSIGNRE